MKENFIDPVREFLSIMGRKGGQAAVKKHAGKNVGVWQAGGPST